VKRVCAILKGLLPLIALWTAGLPAVAGSATPGTPAAAGPVAAPGPARHFDEYAPVTSGQALVFPRDFGSHPLFRTEWWYVTGWLTTAGGESLGFQVTFFRTKPAVDPANPSAFAPRQLLIAHCAISDPRRGRLWQDQRIRRAGLGLAEAAENDTEVWIDDWSLKHAGGQYTAIIVAENFALHLVLADTQPLLLNGVSGVSRKGPASEAASYYYSLPHMKVTGSIARDGRTDRVTGEAWFDHEWSSQYLDDHAAGWDWTGINLDDGSALMAFRIRGLDGGTRWTGGTLRGSDGTVHALDTNEVRFQPGREWTSPRTGIHYPVEWHVIAGARDLELRPLLDDQENDTRLSTGAIYWEGAVRATENGRPVGRGYLELTGYGDRLQLR
jgi:predicted secreted hydrolase